MVSDEVVNKSRCMRELRQHCVMYEFVGLWCQPAQASCKVCAIIWMIEPFLCVDQPVCLTSYGCVCDII